MQPSSQWNAISLADARRPALAAARQARADMLLEAMVCDLQSSALTIGKLAAVFRAYVSTRPLWALAPWRHVLHNDAPVMLLLLRYSQEMDIPAATTGLVDDLYTKLGTAIERSRPVVSSHSHASGEHELVELAQTWGNLCTSSVAVMTVLEAPSRSRLDSRYWENHAKLATFLRDAVSQHHRLVSSTGAVTVPELAQRRQSVRYPVRHNCRILVDGRSHSAVIEDASSTGLRVACNEALRTEQIVFVQLTDGRKLAARIVWQRAGQIGLTLDRPLLRNDALFAF